MVERAKEKVIISPAKSDAPLDRNESFESPFFVFQTKQVTAYKNENVIDIYIYIRIRGKRW